LHGRKIAVDASMAIYQFLIAVRSGGPNNVSAMLTNAEGETTSHIQVRKNWKSFPRRNAFQQQNGNVLLNGLCPDMWSAGCN